jgi:type VI secretion system secreted protein Hcp
MDEIRADASEGPVEQAGSTRRNVLIGATAIAGAAAMVSSLGAGHAGAAASSITCAMPTVPTIGTFALSSLQWGAGVEVSSNGGTGGTRTSRPSVSDITGTKMLDGASTGLFKALLMGQVIDTANITFSLRAGAPTITLVLHDVIVSGYSMSSGGDVPAESLSLNFLRFDLTVNGGTPLVYDLTSQR